MYVWCNRVLNVFLRGEIFGTVSKGSRESEKRMRRETGSSRGLRSRLHLASTFSTHVRLPPSVGNLYLHGFPCSFSTRVHLFYLRLLLYCLFILILCLFLLLILCLFLFILILCLSYIFQENGRAVVIFLERSRQNTQESWIPYYL